jgi:hypothetical protein
VCLTIVAVFPLHLAAATAVSEDVPVPGGLAAFARTLGIDPVPDRGRFMYDVTRLLFDNDPQRSPERLALRFGLTPGAIKVIFERSNDLVPVPLTADFWSDHIFHRRVSRDDLIAAIVSDRQAALLCHGLASLDDETLQFFGEHGSLLSRFVERLAAPAFAAFSAELHVRGNRVVPPGAPHLADKAQGPADRDDVSPLWETIVVEKVTRPERFIQQLFEANEGRLAYLYDVIGQLDPARRAFALGLWMPNAAARVDRFKALTSAGVNSFREWHLRAMPFARASYDVGMTLARIEVEESGAPAPPSARGFWSRVLPGSGSDDERPIDAAWLLEAIGSVDVRQRSERLDQLAFGQRLARIVTAANDRDRSDMLFAVRMFPRYRMLLLTLERIGVANPSVYAAAVRHAARVSVPEGHRGFVAQAQLQGALALAARAVTVRSLDAPKGEALVSRLLALPFGDDGRYAGAVARWVRDDLANAIPPAADMESAIINAISGPSSGERGTLMRVAWEGEQYRLDLGAAERQRLRRVREKQETLPIDVALTIAAAARQLVSDGTALADAQEAIARLTALVDGVPRRSRDDESDNVAPGAGMPAAQHDVLRKTIDELTKTNRSRDPKRTVRAAEPLVDLADDMLAYSLLSIAYAAEVGDPDGAVLLADDVSRRHDFGFGVRDSDIRVRTAWAPPHQEVIPNVPWHVTGSVLGLDIALAPLALRRISFDGVLEAPRLTAPERESFALSVSLMNPFALLDRDRDAIVEEIASGTERVENVTDQTFESLADEISMEGSRRRAFRWTMAHERERLASMLTLSELMMLGGGEPNDYSPWGMAAASSYGCSCTRLLTPGRAAALMGRPQLGLMASIVSDLNLHVAMMLKRLGLPSALTRVVVSGAMQDFIDTVKPSDPADWLTLARTARTATRERIEDYVAVATAAGPLMPVNISQQ